MADDQSTGHPLWRQVLGLLTVVGLAVVILIRPAERTIAATAFAMAASLTMCITISSSAAEQIPDGGVDANISITRSGNIATVTLAGHGYSNGDSIWIQNANQAEYNGTFTIFGVTTNTFQYNVPIPAPTTATGTIFAQKKKLLNNLAYITTSHLESSSEESWRPDGTMGLAMNLMRNGYLTLALPEITQERLDRAAIVVCVGPQREFTSNECEIIRKFVENGGIFILTAGYDGHEASEPLLKTFGFYIGNRPDDSGTPPPPPEPMGHFKSPYINLGDYMPHVRFHAAWP